MRLSERTLDEAFVRELKANPNFLSWLLSRTKFANRELLLDQSEPWQFRWYRDPNTGLDSETDIFLRFEEACAGKPIALHIENKPADGRFRVGQPEAYRPRAEYLKGKLRYDDFQTVLLAPLSFQETFASECAHFDIMLPYEEIAGFVLEFRKALNEKRDAW